MEDLKQTPPASIESDAPSEYMRGYSDGQEQGKRGILARAWVRLVAAVRGYW